MRVRRIRLIALALPLFFAGPASYAVDGLGSTSALSSSQVGGNNPVALNATIAFLQNNSSSGSPAVLRHALIPAGGGNWGYSFLYDTVELAFQATACPAAGAAPGVSSGTTTTSAGTSGTVVTTPSGCMTSNVMSSYQFWAVWYERKKTWLYAGYLYMDGSGCTTQFNNSGTQINQWGCPVLTGSSSSGVISSPAGTSGTVETGSTSGTTQSSGSTQ